MIDYKSETIAANNDLLKVLRWVEILFRFMKEAAPQKARPEVDSIVEKRTKELEDWKARAQARIKTLEEDK